jgi:glutamine amidotransferase PdxT
MVASLHGERVQAGGADIMRLSFHPEQTGDDRLHCAFLARIGASAPVAA